MPPETKKCLCKDKGVIELIEAERAEIRNKFEQVVAGMPGRLFLLPPNVEKVVGYIKEDGIGDVAYAGKEIDLLTLVNETLTLTPSTK